MKKKGFTPLEVSPDKSGMPHQRCGLPTGFTIVELLIVVAVMALLTAALSPLFRTSYQAWQIGDRRAEVIQNARLGMDKMSRELKQAKKITGVSSNTDSQGYITFLDYDGNAKEFRYDGGYLAYDSGSGLFTLAGPIESLSFSCYKRDGSSCPNTSPANISSIVTCLVTSDEEREVDSLTSTDRIYLRKYVAQKGWVQIDWSGGKTTPTLENGTWEAGYSLYYEDDDQVNNQASLEIAKQKIADYVVISEVQADSIAGAGGTKDDWVELYNPTDSPIDLATAGYRIEQTKAAPNPGIVMRIGNADDGSYPGGTTIPAHGYYLIVRDDCEDQDLLNMADAIGTRPEFTWTNSGYTVYLGTGAIDSDDDPDIVDKVGWGSATYYEGSPAPTIPDGGSIERKSGETHSETQGNGYDTDTNSTDWRTRSADDPQNHSSSSEDPPEEYNTSGTLESSVYDTGASGTDYGIMDWDEVLQGQTITFKVRTDINSDMSAALDWSACATVPKGQDISSLNSVNDGDRYIQYKSTFTTTDSLISPTLYEVVIEVE